MPRKLFMLMLILVISLSAQIGAGEISQDITASKSSDVNLSTSTEANSLKMAVPQSSKADFSTSANVNSQDTSILTSSTSTEATASLQSSKLVSSTLTEPVKLSHDTAASTHYDIIIAGGGMGGSAAAIQASRMGARVLIVEPTELLGGQATAAGVSTMDDMSRQDSGLYREFINRVKDYYAKLRKSIATPYWKEHGRAFEPLVGHKILVEMARSADILYHAEIVDVKTLNSRDAKTEISDDNFSHADVIDVKNRTTQDTPASSINTKTFSSQNTAAGSNVKSLSSSKIITVKTSSDVKTFTCKIIIDATEYGDIIPLAGARYRSGNSVSPEIDLDRMIQDITWTAIIRKYPNGVPEHLRPKNPLPDYERAKKNYRAYVTADGFDFRNKYPVKMPVNFISHNAYRAVPDSFMPGSYTGNRKDWRLISKAGVNWGNDYPGQYKWDNRYGMPVLYLESKDFRANANKEALIKTLHFIYYAQNELGENWSVDENDYNFLPEEAKDLPEEWQEIARHMPPIPYVRECRRIIGDYTLNSKAIHDNSMSYREGRKNHEFPDAIAIGGYILDLHGGDDDDDIEASLGENQAAIRRDEPAGAFQVPMRILIPSSVDNFIAAEKNLSMSRLASGALRLQPICMMTGQAAGALAAIAVKGNVQPREVQSVKVQKVLVDSGVNLSLAVYSDVDEKNKHFGSVQIATLHNLIEPKKFPKLPKQRVNSPAKGGITKGSFGVNDIMTKKEIATLIERAEKLSGKKLSLPEKITRGEAVDLVVKAMTE
ncbi:MAG: FAD-dependent oxidoreductase [Synergistaceae bacterium]|nr:FAD-dependent oxidoreductase [Synergistaceae bacterium]